MVLEKTLESPLDSIEIKPVNPKRNQPYIFIGRTDAEAETPTLWSPDVKSWLTGKDPDAGKDWRQEEKGTTEDEMVGWHHWFNGQEFEQIPGDSEGQGSLACCSPWSCKESDTTEWLNWIERESLFVCLSLLIRKEFSRTISSQQIFHCIPLAKLGQIAISKQIAEKEDEIESLI